MADFKDIILNLQANNEEEAKRDSSLNKNIAFSRDKASKDTKETRDVLRGSLEEVSTKVADSTKVVASASTPEEPETPEPNPEEVKQTSFLKRLVNRLVGNKGAEEEQAKEAAASEAENKSILGKIASGIGGLVDKGKDIAKKTGSGLKKILGGILGAGAFFAIAEFLQSPAFGKVAKFVEEKILPPLKTFYKEVVKPAFDAVVEFLMNKAFPAIGDFLTETLIPLLKDTYNNVIKPMFDAIKDFAKDSLFPAVEQIFAKLKETYKKIEPNLTKLFTFLKETTLPALMDTLGKTFENVKNIFLKIVDFVGNIISGDFGKAFDNLKDIGKLILKAIDDAITGVLKMVGLDFEGNVSDVIGRFFDGIFKSISDAVDGVLASIESIIRALPGGDFIADKIFGEQTEEEKRMIEQKKKEAELAEQEAERQEKLLANLKRKKELEDKIAEEQARITRSEVGINEYTGFEAGGRKSSAAAIKRFEFQQKKLEAENKKLMAESVKAKEPPKEKAKIEVDPKAENEKFIKEVKEITKRTPESAAARAKAIQEGKIEGKIATMKGTGGGASVVGTSTKVTNNNSNTTVSNTSYVGNPDMGYKLAAGT